ncbi:MAG: sensor histidine kinase [Gemmatimonadetes bacterium]|nr:sensor histidine kinase [Gemmatimonadota bacterium]
MVVAADAGPPSADAGRAPEAAASRRLMEVAERELQRILLDIHDGPVQGMYAALSQVDLVRRALDVGTPEAMREAHERLTRIRTLLEHGLTEVRTFIGEFRPPQFGEKHLQELLESLALQHEAMTDTAVQLDLAPAVPDVALPVKIALYRVMQEALSNAYRHGGARRVTVRVAPAGAGRLAVEIADDGAGFDPATPLTPDHFGLSGMRDRVETIGGTYTLRSAPGAGTTVHVEVPTQ